MNELADRNVLVLGLGASGLAMAAWCARQGARVQVWDSREAPPQAAALAERVPGARRLPCATGPEALAGVHWVLKSPGLAPHDAQVAPLLEAARAAGIRTGGELDLFVQALAELRATRGYAPRLLAVTGTNGKTTTTALAALLIERAGRTARAAGNIGPTMLDSLAQALQADALPQVWVLELSSFQLHDLHPTAPYQPDAAVVLNLSQDHLDWHGTMDDYAAAKARVFGAHGTVVINADDARVAAMAPAVPEASALRRGARRAAAAVPRPVVRFGLQVPRHGGDFGLVSEAGMSWLVRALPREEGVRPAAAEEEPPIIQRLMPADAMRLRGRHNAANALAALALACAIGCPLAPMLHGLRDYRGEPHRVQWVAEVEGVEAFDDSKGTNVGATVAALEGLGAERAPGRLVLILGGDGKGQDFSALAGPVARHARAVALIGRDAPALAQALQGTGVALQPHADLPQAVRWCFEQAQRGDAVLLSPACASLDMFRGYGHRAEVFVQAVQACVAERGGVVA